MMTRTVLLLSLVSVCLGSPVAQHPVYAEPPPPGPYLPHPDPYALAPTPVYPRYPHPPPPAGYQQPELINIPGPQPETYHPEPPQESHYEPRQPQEPNYEEEEDEDDLNNIPGEPGKDYPIYPLVPNTGFSCSDKLPGFYADDKAQCQVWHYCKTDGFLESFLCPNGTIYNQENRVCEWWFNVRCEDSIAAFKVNEDLYIVPSTTEAPLEYPAPSGLQYIAEPQPQPQVYRPPQPIYDYSQVDPEGPQF